MLRQFSLCFAAVCGLVFVAAAQTPCDHPRVGVKANGKLIRAYVFDERAPEELQVVMQPAAGCPAAQVVPTEVEFTVTRNKRSVTSVSARVKGDRISLRNVLTQLMVGDRISCEVLAYDIVGSGTTEHRTGHQLVVLPVIAAETPPK